MVSPKISIINIVLIVSLWLPAYGSDCQSDCNSECTNQVTHACIGTISTPIRTCTDTYVDPACVARCTVEKTSSCNGLANFVGCNIWMTNQYWQIGVALVRNSGISASDCHSLVNGGSTATTAFGVIKFAQDLDRWANLMKNTTVITFAVTEAVKHASQCACDYGQAATETPPIVPPSQDKPMTVPSIVGTKQLARGGTINFAPINQPSTRLSNSNKNRAGQVFKFEWYEGENPNLVHYMNREYTHDPQWTEISPDHHIGKLVESAVETVNGEVGVIVRRDPYDGIDIFIPDHGSTHMELLYRDNASTDWRALSKMRNTYSR